MLDLVNLVIVLVLDARYLVLTGIREFECKKNILTAANTYKTVALSKDVAALMAVSRRAFDAISGLSVPDLRPFENERMKDAFSQLTRELRK